VQMVGLWREEETWIWTFASRRRAGVGKSRVGSSSSSSGPDKYEGSGQDRAGESGDDEERVELNPKWLPLLHATAADLIPKPRCRVLRYVTIELVVDNLAIRRLGRTDECELKD
jgi:hypothetical protein